MREGSAISSVVDPAQLRQVMRGWATGVTVVTTRSPSGIHGITVNSFTSLSLDPPLCLICIQHDARAHREIPASGGFAVNILAADQAHISDRFAGRTKVEDLFAGLDLDAAPSGAPVFRDVLGYLDCVLHAELPGGDHTIYVGRVAHAAACGSGEPLLFYGGRYRELATP